MAYTPQTWTDGSSSTPLSAARLNHMESGIASAAATADAARPATWKPASTDITDSTATGRSVLTAASAAAARGAIGAGTSSLVLGSASDTAKPGDYQPTSTDVSDATDVGRTLMTAADAAAARAAIGAGTSSFDGSWSSLTDVPSTFTPPAASTSAVGGVLQGAAVADSSAADVAGVVADLNALLASLRAAGVIASS